jgi:hypothetical protein
MSHLTKKFYSFFRTALRRDFVLRFKGRRDRFMAGHRFFVLSHIKGVGTDTCAEPAAAAALIYNNSHIIPALTSVMVNNDTFRC